jgi:hypothetical protein
MDSLAQFVDNLIDEAGLRPLPAGFEAEYKQRLMDQVVERLGLIVMENLTEEQAKEYSDVLMNQATINGDRLAGLIRSIPGLEDKITAGLSGMANEFLANVQQARNGN